MKFILILFIGAIIISSCNLDKSKENSTYSKKMNDSVITNKREIGSRNDTVIINDDLANDPICIKVTESDYLNLFEGEFNINKIPFDNEGNIDTVIQVTRGSSSVEFYKTSTLFILKSILIKDNSFFTLCKSIDIGITKQRFLESFGGTKGSYSSDTIYVNNDECDYYLLYYVRF